jgi:hypothetical protein
MGDLHSVSRGPLHAKSTDVDLACFVAFDRLLKYIEADDGPTPTLYAYGSAGPEEQYEMEEKFGLPSSKGR